MEWSRRERRRSRGTRMIGESSVHQGCRSNRRSRSNPNFRTRPTHPTSPTRRSFPSIIRAFTPTTRFFSPTPAPAPAPASTSTRTLRGFSRPPSTPTSTAPGDAPFFDNTQRVAPPRSRTCKRYRTRTSYHYRVPIRSKGSNEAWTRMRREVNAQNFIRREWILKPPFPIHVIQAATMAVTVNTFSRLCLGLDDISGFEIMSTSSTARRANVLHRSGCSVVSVSWYGDTSRIGMGMWNSHSDGVYHCSTIGR
jgi:hypothetical protein